MLTYPLWPYRGDTGRWRFVLWADAARTVPVDLEGVTVAAEIRGAPLGALLVTLQCTVTAPNLIDVVLAGASAAALPLSAVWDLQLTYPGGDVQTIVAGPVQARGDVTQTAGLVGSGVAHA